ncbi:Biofilm and cell wall regulator 1 [Ceratobasidium theobromae]|uniref:Biofilm and cell wall regulator 1 n=1 Tax=Ceratobasidium theobromae TaxID=1582974 RepID=A0A5N5QUB5_9AGAM|nr:Biofilm and cell wall regulator 1 [Ceratobasidium theobromae]
MKTESTPPKAPPTPPKAASTSPSAPSVVLGDDAPRAKKTSVGPVRTRAAPSKTFVCRGFGDCSMVFSRSEHLARHVRKHTGERPFACHCGKQFSRLDNLRQHAQTVHSDKVELNERMMRDLTSLHTALAASSHRNLPRLSPSQPAPAPVSRSQPSTPSDPHPPGVVPSMAYDYPEPFLQSFRADQPFRPFYPHFQPPAELHPHAAGRHGIGRFLAANGPPGGPLERTDPRRERDGLDRERTVDDGGGSKPFTSGGSAGGGLPPISTLIPREPQPLFPPAPPRPATAGGLSWPPGRPAWQAAARPATAAAPLGFGSAAPSRPGTSNGLALDRGDVFAFEPPALAAPRYRDDDPDDPYALPFGLRPGTAPAASFDRAGRGREWERERSWHRRDQSAERRHDARYEHGRPRLPLGTDPDRLAPIGHAPPSPRDPDTSLALGRRGSGGLSGDDRELGLLSPGPGGYDSPFSWHPPGLAPRKRSYDFGPGDAPGSDSRPSSRRLTLMELCSADPTDDHPAPLGLSPNGKSSLERGREPPSVPRPATVGGGDGPGLPGIASFGPIRDRPGPLSLGPAPPVYIDGSLPRDDSLPPPPSPPATAVGQRDDDGNDASAAAGHPGRVPQCLLDRRDAPTSGSDSESDDRFQRGAGLSNPALGPSPSPAHWRGGECERLRGQVRTPISPPPTAIGVRASPAA